MTMAKIRLYADRMKEKSGRPIPPKPPNLSCPSAVRSRRSVPLKGACFLNACTDWTT